MSETHPENLNSDIPEQGESLADLLVYDTIALMNGITAGAVPRREGAIAVRKNLDMAAEALEWPSGWREDLLKMNSYDVTHKQEGGLHERTE